MNIIPNIQVYPSVSELKKKLSCFRDLIAYRIVISMPKCHFKSEQERRDAELNCLYEISNVLPEFLEERGLQQSLQMVCRKAVHLY